MCAVALDGGKLFSGSWLEPVVGPCEPSVYGYAKRTRERVTTNRRPNG